MLSLLPFVPHPGYASGRWYVPWGKGTESAGSAPGANSIRLAPGYLLSPVTITALGLRVGTTSAGGHVQAAIYAHDRSTQIFYGNPLISVGSMATDTAASVAANLAGNVLLNPGLYWFASNCDSGTAVFSAFTTSSLDVAANIGASSQGGTIGGSGSGITGFSVSQTFGTWPDLTGASATGIITSSVPLIQFKVA